jgi:N-acetylneuraminate synthase
MTTAETFLDGLVNGARHARLRSEAVRPLARIGKRWVGAEQPTYVIAEIGINHNGSLDLAKALVDVAASAGCDAVKLQKRTPELCVPREQWDVPRDTPWGRMTYLSYKRRVEFGDRELAELSRHCRKVGIPWFASCWDLPSVDAIERFDPPCYKVASASLTDLELLAKLRATGRPLILSTGMSTREEIQRSIAEIGTDQLLVAHATSAYPCAPEQLNLRMIATLQSWYPECPIGYSGHEQGLATTVAAVALGAAFVERHITLDRSMWGTDHSASLDPEGLNRLVREIREVEASLGDGIKRVYDSELPILKKLRRVS